MVSGRKWLTEAPLTCFHKIPADEVISVKATGDVFDCSGDPDTPAHRKSNNVAALVAFMAAPSRREETVACRRGQTRTGFRRSDNCASMEHPLRCSLRPNLTSLNKW